MGGQRPRSRFALAPDAYPQPANSLTLAAVNVARVAALASWIWPAPLLVRHTTRTSAPVLAYWQGSAHAEIFVVRVREDAQYTRRALAGSAHRDVVRHRVQLIAPPPAAMASAICPKSYLTAAST